MGTSENDSLTELLKMTDSLQLIDLGGRQKQWYPPLNHIDLPTSLPNLYLVFLGARTFFFKPATLQLCSSLLGLGQDSDGPNPQIGSECNVAAGSNFGSAGKVPRDQLGLEQIPIPGCTVPWRGKEARTCLPVLSQGRWCKITF